MTINVKDETLERALAQLVDAARKSTLLGAIASQVTATCDGLSVTVRRDGASGSSMQQFTGTQQRCEMI